VIAPPPHEAEQGTAGLDPIDSVFADAFGFVLQARSRDEPDQARRSSLVPAADHGCVRSNTGFSPWPLNVGLPAPSVLFEEHLRLGEVGLLEL